MKSGWLQDSQDYRDKSAKEVLRGVTTFGDQANWEQHLPPVLNQQSTGSCVGKSGAGAFATKTSIQSAGATKFLPSASFFYSIARLIEGKHHQDSGARIRNLMKAAAKHGVCPAEDWPFSVSTINLSPNWNAFRKAIDQRWLTGYYRIDSWGDERISEVKQALFEGHVPIFGMHVTDRFVDYTGGVMPDMTGTVRGGHAMFLYGYYHNEFFNGQNSWGNTWGETGRFRFAPKVLSRFRDIWIFQTVPNYSGT